MKPLSYCVRRWAMAKARLYSSVAGSKYTTNQIRQSFVNFFVDDHGHQFIPSSSVVPLGNPTLLFTNSGMNQFKAIFLGGTSQQHTPFANVQRAVNSQKCVRVGGKHNDLADVGNDGYHHTFFEMLGNWSFGNYFKKEACEMAWEFLTRVYRLPPEKLYVTYFGGNERQSSMLQPDEECKDIWLQIGVPVDHILPFGMKDNFWDMGESGPCGPCTEIHYSRLAENDCSRLVNAGTEDVIELWNLVFMQYFRQANGNLQRLPKCHVDTGMGLERLSAVLQGCRSNYDTDLFQPLFRAIQKEAACRPYSGQYGLSDTGVLDRAYRILADHSRMSTVCISDGLLPDGTGAGQCLRRIIRRAIMASTMTLKTSGLLAKMAPYVADSLEEAFPEISLNIEKVVSVIKEEEDRFSHQLIKGVKVFEKMTTTNNGSSILPAKHVTELYCAHGIPEEIIIDLAAAKGLIPDIEGFQQQLVEEKMKSQKAFKENAAWKVQLSSAFDEIAAHTLIGNGISPTDDTSKYNMIFSSEGLSIPSISSSVLALWDGQNFVDTLLAPFPSGAAVITQATNFYAEAGGQNADAGHILSEDGGTFQVTDVRNQNGYIVHLGSLTSGTLRVNSKVTMTVDMEHRGGCTRSHTATHLLNAALHKVLGSTEQRSSHVSVDHLRLDFTTKTALSKEQMYQLEAFISDAIARQCPVQRLNVNYEDVKKLPHLRSLHGEVYPDVVSVIAIYSDKDRVTSNFEDKDNFISLEPCCGTHLVNTSYIRDFVILSQKSVAQAVRSIQAATGLRAQEARQAAANLRTSILDLSTNISKMEGATDKQLNNDLVKLDGILGNKRSLVAEDSIPLSSRDHLDKKIEELQRRLKKLIRTQVKNELQYVLAQCTSENPKYLVHLFQGDSLAQTVMKEAMKHLPNMPSLIVVVGKEVTQGYCCVPEEMISDSFNAELWVKKLLKNISGEGLPFKNSPTTTNYAFKTSATSDKIIESLEVVKQFVHGICDDK